MLSLVFILMMLSLAGLPISAGFFGTLYLFTTAVHGAQWFLTAVFIAGSALGLYYYLRLVYVQINRGDASAQVPAAAADPAAGAATVISIVIAAVVIFVLGVYPSLLLSILHGV